MTITFEKIRLARGDTSKASYHVLVDGVRVGHVAHKKVDHVSRFSAWTKNGVQNRTRRSRPLAWVATGTVGRRQVRVVRTTREAAVQAMLDEIAGKV